MASTSESLNSRLFCTQCGRPFPAEDLARFGASMVCADCKPTFVQQMREGAPVAAQFVYGGFWRRFAAFLIDAVILVVITFPLRMILGPAMVPNLNNPTPATAFGFFGVNWLISTAVNLAYYVWFLSQKSATPGKMVLGLKVVTATGERISVGRATARYFAEILSSLILFIGFIMIAFDSQKRALHDHICNTRVIREA
ncbi:MAG: RDD family protein [Acidobacteriaceae bacterium]|nr:RDD family protein [Acidobacteriaceae bacterium]